MKTEKLLLNMTPEAREKIEKISTMLDLKMNAFIIAAAMEKAYQQERILQHDN